MIHLVSDRKGSLDSYDVKIIFYYFFPFLLIVVKAFLCFYEDCGYEKAHFEDVRLPMALQAYEAWGK